MLGGRGRIYSRNESDPQYDGAGGLNISEPAQAARLRLLRQMRGEADTFVETAVTSEWCEDDDLLL